MKYYNYILAFTMTFLMGVWAWANQIPETIEESYSFVGPFINAILEGKWLVVGGIALMTALVFVRQKVLPKYPKLADYMPIITLIIGVLGKVGHDLYTIQSISSDWWKGAIVALGTMGAWDLIGKSITKLLVGEKYLELEDAKKAASKK